MSTKIYRYLLIILASVLSQSFTSYKGYAQCVHSLSSTYVELPAEGGGEEIYVVTEECENYDTYSNDEWLYTWVDYYDQIVTVYADANYDVYRQGTIIVDDWESENDYNISVSQDYGCQQLPAPSSITGPNDACSGSSQNFSVGSVEGADSYVWKVNGNTVTGQYTTSATISVGYTNPAVVSACAYDECGEGIPVSKQVTIHSAPSAGTIGYSQTIDFNDVPASFTNLTSASDTYGTFYYQWQSAADGLNNWTNINDATGSGYSSGSLTSITDFRRAVTDNCATGYSNTLKVTPVLDEVAYSTGEAIADPETRELNESYEVGTSPGSINVNSLGSATYEVPVFTPPGSAGMQPSLSIFYNSHGKNGLLGQRWDIGGLSEIQRVPRDLYHDGEVKGVELAATDIFALDSNRLVITSQGTYGADGTTYATEFETFVKVTANGASGSGPSWFKVETKDGRTIEYGNTLDSKVEAYGSSTVYKWRINKVYDQYGNTIKYYYYESNGESFISHIDYTTNENASINTPYNTVEFEYKKRTDVNSKYIGGFKIPETVLLNSIVVKTENSAKARGYSFKYYKDSSSVSYLNEIIEYGSDDSRLNSTVIGWGTPASHFLPGEVIDNTTVNKYYLGDFNGDGKTDYIVTPKKSTYTGSDTWKLYFARFDTIGFSYADQGYLDSQFKGFYVANVDGDGESEVYWKNVTTSTVQFLLYNCEPYHLERGSTSFDMNFTGADASTYLLPADFDGDGKSDYLVLYSGYHLLSAIVGGSSRSGMSFSTPDDVRIIDFDGDGRQEVLVIDGVYSSIYQYNISSHTFSEIRTSGAFPTNNHRIFTGDFNRDKKTDLITWKSGIGWQLYFSTGTDYVLSGNVPPLINTDPEGSQTDNNYYVSDFNGDGKTDILEAYKESTASEINVYYNVGDGIFYTDSISCSKSSINQDYFNFGDFNGDGKQDLFFYDYSQASNKVNLYHFHKEELKTMVTEIANGLNYKTKITYDRLNNGYPFYYIYQFDSEYPVYDYKGPYYAVSKIERDDGVGGKLAQEFWWEKAKIHRQGRGFLGFSSETVTDTAHFTRSLNVFDFNDSYYYRYLSESHVYNYIPGVILDTLSRAIYTNSVKNSESSIIFPYVSQTINKNIPLKNTMTTNFTYDDYGNLTFSETTFTNDEDGHVEDAVKSTTNTYEQYENYGIPNKLTNTVDTSQYAGEPEYIRQKTFNYNSNGSLASIISDPNKSKAVTSTFSSYNYFGIPAHITISASGLTSRTTINEYDSKGRFITGTTNPAGQSSGMTYDPGTGNILSSTGIDGLTTEYNYNGFGRLFETITPQSNHVSVATDWDVTGSGGSNSVYLTTTDAEDQPYTKAYYDILGRVVKSETEGISGSVFTEKIYEPNGLIKQQSYPHLNSETAKWGYFDYDTYGRLIEYSASLTKINYEYSDKSVIITRQDSLYKTIRKNSLGDIIKVEMPGSTSTDFTYHSSGQARYINATSTITDIDFDEYGLPQEINSTNSGTVTRIFNAFGELTSQTDANDITTTFQYDVLGRITTKVDPDGTTSYVYKTSGNGIGQLESITGPNSISKSFIYNSDSRISQITDDMPNDAEFVTSFSYDSWGNNTSITYPSGLTINNIFDNGYMTEIQKSDNSSIWTLDEVNGAAQPLLYTLGNVNLKTNFTYDVNRFLYNKLTGNMEQGFYFDAEFNRNLTNRTYKEHNSQSELIEHFTYDPLDRLNITRLDLNPVDTVQYNPNGNISYKHDIGNYDYNHSNALESIFDNPGTISTTDQTITYTPFNKVSNITEDPYELELTYGPDDQRIKTVLKEDNDIIRTKYFSMNYEKVITDASTREFNYIYCPYGLIAVIVKTSTTENLYYVETDHLGSIIGLINPNGTYAEHYSYDAWGRRRNPTDWTYDNVSQPSLIDRGFTGHEHLDEFGLINMNGRVYDPYIGRFLSVDPVVQFPDNSQSYTGYSYCLNNPLKYTDPSGMLLEPRINPVDEGHPYNSEAAAWLANYYSQSFGGGGGGGYGGDSHWVNSYLDYSHACFENGGEVSVSDFDNKVNTSSNGSITIQTGTIDYYTFTSIDGGKHWHKGNYIDSEPVYSNIQVGSSDDSRGWIFGQSIDITIATPGGGYTGEGGWVITSNGKKGEQFVTHGIAFGLEATVGWNLLIINPKSNFKFNDLKGQGASWTANFWIFSISAFTNSSQSYPINSVFDSYKGFKIGVGIGGGISTAPNSTTTFKNWIPKDINYMNFHWH